MAEGSCSSSHGSSLFSKNGRNLTSTVRPNGVTVQAFEPGIPAKNRWPPLTLVLDAFYDSNNARFRHFRDGPHRVRAGAARWYRPGTAAGLPSDHPYQD